MNQKEREQREREMDQNRATLGVRRRAESALLLSPVSLHSSYITMKRYLVPISEKECLFLPEARIDPERSTTREEGFQKSDFLRIPYTLYRGVINYCWSEAIQF